MGEWIDFDRWSECPQMERPGYVFEIVNEAGLSLLTPCTTPLVVPFDWKSEPVKFRVVPEERAKHSTPLPGPSK